MPFSLPKQTDDHWQLSKLRYESEDVVVELLWQKQVLRVTLETSKSVNEKECKDLAEVEQEISRFVGKKRTQDILQNWHEVSYRRIF